MRLFALVPQLLIVLFMLKMVHNSYLRYKNKPTPLTEKELINLIAGLIVFNAVLAWGGFYNVVI